MIEWKFVFLMLKKPKPQIKLFGQYRGNASLGLEIPLVKPRCSSAIKKYGISRDFCHISVAYKSSRTSPVHTVGIYC